MGRCPRDIYVPKTYIHLYYQYLQLMTQSWQKQFLGMAFFFFLVVRVIVYVYLGSGSSVNDRWVVRALAESIHVCMLV